MTHKSLRSGCSFQSLTAVKTNIESAIFHYYQLLCLSKPERLILPLILLPLFALGECKYNFQAWGECDLATGKKNRTGVLKRALMDATCAATVTATKPCGKMPKAKLQGKLKKKIIALSLLATMRSPTSHLQNCWILIERYALRSF